MSAGERDFLAARRGPSGRLSGSGLAGERGVALTEFALILPLLMVLLLGILDLGKAFNYWIDQTHLANEGARWAAVDYNPGAAAGATLQQYIASKANTAELKSGGTESVSNPLRVCILFPSAGSTAVGEPVEVRVRTTFKWIPLIGDQVGALQTTITGSATMRIEGKPTNYTAGDGLTGGTCP